MAIQPIPTLYKGIRFRSRLESRWAEFFDRHDIAWKYEEEGYDLDGVWYLPDFYLPKCRTFVEVKGVLDVLSVEKITRLAAAGMRGPTGPGFNVVVAEAAGIFWQVEADGCRAEDTCLIRCNRCREWYFLDMNGSWACIVCGFYDGDNTYDCYNFHRGSDTHRDALCCSVGR